MRRWPPTGGARCSVPGLPGRRDGPGRARPRPWVVAVGRAARHDGAPDAGTPSQSPASASRSISSIPAGRPARTHEPVEQRGDRQHRDQRQQRVAAREVHRQGEGDCGGADHVHDRQYGFSVPSREARHRGQPREEADEDRDGVEQHQLLLQAPGCEQDHGRDDEVHDHRPVRRVVPIRRAERAGGSRAPAPSGSTRQRLEESRARLERGAGRC